MARISSNASLCALLVLALVIAAPRAADSAISCGTAVSAISPCLKYIRGLGPLTPGCCGGVRQLNAAAATTPDRQAACNCLKSASNSFPDLKTNLAGGLPGKCGVNFGYTISRTIDCSTVR